MTPWQHAQTALALLAIDPKGLGGITLRARVGPARDAFLTLSKQIDPKPVRLHPAMTTDALDGAIDLAATLDAGHIVHHKGLLTRTDHLFILTMAERADPYLAARLSMALDAGDMSGLIALDEGAEEDEAIAGGLSDRLAFQITLDQLSLADITPDQGLINKTLLTPIDIPTDLPEQLVILASRLGIHSLRAPSFALRAAKAHAALSGRNRVETDDVTAAVELVFAHRATQVPQTDDTPPPETESTDTPPPETRQTDSFEIPDDLLLEAVLSSLPEGLLDSLKTSKSKGGIGSGSGKKIIGNRRGRPLPARDTGSKTKARVDLMATLRTAVPWQSMRKAAQPDRMGPILRPSDLRHKRYEELSDRVLVFSVDASGSAALARLGEAKGAVELLLAQAYARRDHVALVAFRGSDADVLLPPTRSLVQTKRRLASLPGGGGTPLASGLSCALSLCDSARKRGQTPTLVVLTDGRSNIALDGSPNRQQAAEDATYVARQIALRGFDSIVIDTGIRPEQSLKALATTMDGKYIALPRADAQRLSDAVSSTLTP